VIGGYETKGLLLLVVYLALEVVLGS
jgi:hypothetical protein